MLVEVKAFTALECLVKRFRTGITQDVFFQHVLIDSKVMIASPRTLAPYC